MMEVCRTPSPPSKRMLPRSIDSEGPYHLLYCSGKGDKTRVIRELEKGVDINLADYDKRTALHLAACEGCIEIVVLLLEKGADVNSTDRWGRTVSYTSTI
ncbi:potassium channel KOR1-like isoform X2 [Carica papaya]|uniref:potassium channel KOR1-like isoform X2 n=1 Tax=Carica papaya TaxID=3649 RepID=UPI000B8CA81E|nr:potassium channel KOR1-like isoform X2 [Carica papaya]